MRRDFWSIFSGKIGLRSQSRRAAYAIVSPQFIVSSENLEKIMGRNTKIRKSYHFFTDAEKRNLVFTLDDVAASTEWSIKTVQAYRSKKWYFFLKEVDEGFMCDGILNLSEDAYVRIHAQRATIDDEYLRPRFSNEVDALIDKSRESALLGIQTFNNPLLKFRAPGFIVNMIIAYTALFHAIFERNGVDYWYKEEDGTPEITDGDFRYWELNACIKQYYGGDQTPEKENLKLFINLRNKIEHRFIPALDMRISGYCQALLLNFERLLVKEFGSYFVLCHNNLTLALQLSEYSSHQQDVLRKIQSEHFDNIQTYISKYRRSLPDDILISNNFCFRAFLIPIIGNHAKSSDIAIEFVKYDPDNPEEMAQYEKQVAFIKQKRVQVADQGKFRPTEVANRVSEITGEHFGIHYHTRAWKLYKVRPRGIAPEECDVKYCQFSVPFKTYIYTEAWVEFLCEKVQDQAEFERIKSYRD